MCQSFYYKIRKLSQNSTILLQNAPVISKRDAYYKICRHNVQIYTGALKNYDNAEESNRFLHSAREKCKL